MNPLTKLISACGRSANAPSSQSSNLPNLRPKSPTTLQPLRPLTPQPTRQRSHPSKDRLPPRRIPSLTILLVFPMLVAVFAVACNGSAPSPTASNPVMENSAGGAAGTDIAAPGSLIDLETATNGVDADEPIGPQIPAGDPVTWTYVVTNTGSLPMIGIRVTDDQLGTIDCPRTTLPAGMFMTCTAMGVGRPAVPTKSPTPVVSLIRKKTSWGMRPSGSSCISTKT